MHEGGSQTVTVETEVLKGMVATSGFEPEIVGLYSRWGFVCKQKAAEGLMRCGWWRGGGWLVRVVGMGGGGSGDGWERKWVG